jgi:hypothetical protein
MFNEGVNDEEEKKFFCINSGVDVIKAFWPYLQGQISESVFSNGSFEDLRTWLDRTQVNQSKYIVLCSCSWPYQQIY